MAASRHPKGGLLIAALLGACAVWSLFTHPRLAPALAAFAVAQMAMVIFWMRARAGRPSPELIRAYLGVSYLGLAYLVAAVAADSGGVMTSRFLLVSVLYWPSAGRRGPARMAAHRANPHARGRRSPSMTPALGRQ